MAFHSSHSTVYFGLLSLKVLCRISVRGPHAMKVRQVHVGFSTSRSYNIIVLTTDSRFKVLSISRSWHQQRNVST